MKLSYLFMCFLGIPYSANFSFVSTDRFSVVFPVSFMICKSSLHILVINPLLVLDIENLSVCYFFGCPYGEYC